MVCKPHLKDDSRLLQQVRPHVSADDVVALVEADLYVLPKAAAVVVPGGFGVSYGLKTRGIISASALVITCVSSSRS